MAAFGSSHSPPSEKESGVTLTTPTTKVRLGCGKPGTTGSGFTRITLCSLLVPHPPYRLRHRLMVSVRALLILVLALGALTACRATGGGIPGIEPPRAQQTAPAAPSNPSPSSAPSVPAATPKSGQGQTHSRLNTSLAENSIYSVDLGNARVSCKIKVRSPKPPLQDTNLGSYGKRLVSCLVKAFAKPLDALGIQLSTPRMKAYRKTIKTPCGRFGQGDAPAYYCSVTRTIYWPVRGDDASEAYTFARLGYVGLVAHEFGHHMQAESGMLREYGERAFAAKSRGQRYLLSRRLELQAQCFEGIFLATAARSIDLSSNDRYQLRVWHTYTGDEDPPSGRKPDHGSSAAQIRWLSRGLESADFGRCNTWKASKKSVK
jgi:hypothetical protein